jgi:hypothetical protein
MHKPSPAERAHYGFGPRSLVNDAAVAGLLAAKAVVTETATPQAGKRKKKRGANSSTGSAKHAATAPAQGREPAVPQRQAGTVTVAASAAVNDSHAAAANGHSYLGQDGRNGAGHGWLQSAVGASMEPVAMGQGGSSLGMPSTGLLPVNMGLPGLSKFDFLPPVDSFLPSIGAQQHSALPPGELPAFPSAHAESSTATAGGTAQVPLGGPSTSLGTLIVGSSAMGLSMTGGYEDAPPPVPLSQSLSITFPPFPGMEVGTGAAQQVQASAALPAPGVS